MANERLNELTKELLEQLYIKEEKSLTYISNTYNVPRHLLRRKIVSHGFSIRDNISNTSPKKLNFLSYETLYQLYCVDEKSLYQIGKLYNVSQNTVSTCLQDFKIPIRDKNKIEIKLQDLTHDNLYQMYWVEEKSLTSIANTFDVCRTTLIGYFEKFNIKIRTLQEANILANSGDKNPMRRPEIVANFLGENNHNFGRTLSDDTKKAISVSLKKTFKEIGSPNLGRKRPDLLGKPRPTEIINRIKATKRKRINEKLKELTYQTLHKLHYIDDLSISKIEKKYNLRSIDLKNHMQSIKFLTKNNLKETKLEELTYEILYQLNHIEEKTITEIAKIYNITYKQINNVCKKLNFVRKDGSYIKSKLKHLTYDIFYNLYWVEEKSLNKIAKIYGVGLETIREKVEKLNIKIRSRLETIKLTSSGENHPNWKGGITPLLSTIRSCKEYHDWRVACFVRDNRTCKICGVCDNNIEFHIDHIIPFSYIIKNNNITTFEQALKCEILFDISNGRCLCVDCHEATPTFGRLALNYTPPYIPASNNIFIFDCF